MGSPPPSRSLACSCFHVTRRDRADVDLDRRREFFAGDWLDGFAEHMELRKLESIPAIVRIESSSCGTGALRLPVQLWARSGRCQLEKGDYKTEVKNDKVGERHIVSENGDVLAKRREAAVLARRKESEANIVSLRKRHHVQSISMEGGKGRVPFSNRK